MTKNLNFSFVKNKCQVRLRKGGCLILPRFNQGRQARPTERLEPLNNLADDTSVYYGEKKRVMRHTKEIKVKEMGD